MAKVKTIKTSERVRFFTFDLRLSTLDFIKRQMAKVETEGRFKAKLKTAVFISHFSFLLF